MAEKPILFIRKEEKRAQPVENALRTLEGGLEWVRVDSLFDGLRMLQERLFDLILSDLSLPDGKGLATVQHLKQDAPRTPLIVFCSLADRDLAVRAVRKGAHDFFCYEELDPERLRRAVSLALESHDSEPGGTNGADRRTSARFPFRLAVSYQALEHPFFSGQTTGETVNISSKGLLFAASEALQQGQLLQVSVDWPARLGNEVPLKLVAEGRVVRNIDGMIAMRIDKYEFRTRRIKTAPPEGGSRRN